VVRTPNGRIAFDSPNAHERPPPGAVYGMLCTPRHSGARRPTLAAIHETA